jgi:hypothetical protein
MGIETLFPNAAQIATRQRLQWWRMTVIVVEEPEPRTGNVKKQPSPVSRHILAQMERPVSISQLEVQVMLRGNTRCTVSNIDREKWHP